MLGPDSMQSVGLLFDLEDAYGVMLTDDALTAEAFATPRSLYEAVRAAGAEPDALAS